ncbi:leucyl aminopeptidase [Naasia sp. SYSU D00057]|uniref:leucyl aminopeptidase n=1 Tax=Naasia sp. SYSU D00057 TaxID=2817380 RepID=UPI001B3072AB|nr:leucyl aminopeptidase [Naasia sp. SYSU D00057]
MPLPTLRLSSELPADIEADVLVLGATKNGDGVRTPELPGLESLAGLLEGIGVTGARDQVVRIPGTGIGATSIAIVGLGGEATPEALRYAAGAVTRQVRGVRSIAFALPVEDDEAALAVLEGAAIGAYSFDEYRVDSRAGAKSPAAEITVLAPSTDEALVRRAEIAAEAVATVRDLVNMPPSDLYPETLAERAQQLAEGVGVEVTVWDEHDLERDGFGGILGVGKGSVRPPRLVKVVWAPEGAEAHLALVGKGITFDSGGLSLKPAASMVGMKYDMTGAATVLAVALAAAKLAAPVKVTAWLCIAENMPSGSATRPNDVLRIRGGKTVEVLNTDAEGRLVLADGLVAAAEEQPDAIIDVATLTGAATVALGTRYVGLMGDDEPVAGFLEAAEKTGELAWRMPLPGELRAVLNSDIADIANAKPGNTAAGMLLAATFLKDFVGTRPDGTPIPWAHLDIAGAANNGGGGFGFVPAGPTGVTVRALIAFAEGFATPSGATGATGQP